MYSERYTYLPIAFAPSRVEKTLAQTVSECGRTQLHLAESEKYAHVTFFFNGGNQQPFSGEDDVRVPSHKGVPFESVPELKLPEVAERLRKGLDKGYDFIVANFANGDVIGHTSSDEAKPLACEAVSRYVGKTVAYAREKGILFLLQPTTVISRFCIPPKASRTSPIQRIRWPALLWARIRKFSSSMAGFAMSRQRFFPPWAFSNPKK